MRDLLGCGIGVVRREEAAMLCPQHDAERRQTEADIADRKRDHRSVEELPDDEAADRAGERRIGADEGGGRAGDSRRAAPSPWR